MSGADIDIDCADRTQVLELIEYTSARQRHDKKARVHNTGIYVTPIPYDPFKQCAAIDYQRADERGYFKIDLLNMTVYQQIRNYDHYNKLLAIEPDWSVLWTNKELAKKVVHVGNYVSLMKRMKPDSLLKIAALISIIRPGKAHLQHKSWDEVMLEVWDGNRDDGYTFRKSHAISYAMLVKIHLNLLIELDSLD